MSFDTKLLVEISERSKERGFVCVQHEHPRKRSSQSTSDGLSHRRSILTVYEASALRCAIIKRKRRYRVGLSTQVSRHFLFTRSRAFQGASEDGVHQREGDTDEREKYDSVGAPRKTQGFIPRTRRGGKGGRGQGMSWCPCARQFPDGLERVSGDAT